MARKPEVHLTDTIETWRQKTNRLSSIVGEPDDLSTTNKIDIVSAINEVKQSSGTDFVRAQISAITTGGGNYASLAYNNNSGVLTFTTNTLQSGDIPQIDASKVPTGVFNASQIPSLDASKITTGIIDIARLPQSVRDATGGIGVSTTDDLPEGSSNLYFTTSRARQSIIAGSNITYDSTTGVISATGGGDVVAEVDLKVDPDYDAPTDKDNNWAAHSFRSIYFFLDTNKNEGSNYFGIYNDVDPYNDTVNRDNAIFRVDETGDVNVTGVIRASTSGIEFPLNAFGGSGDTAKIYLTEAAGGGGEATQLTLQMTNDLDDEIHLRVPSANGVKINGFTAYHEGNLGAAALSPNVPLVRDVFIETIQNSGVYYFNSSQYPANVSRPPDQHEIILVCKAPQHGYVVGDEIYLGQQSDPAGKEEGIVVTRHNNSLILQLRIGQNGPGQITNKNSGTGHILTAANWSVRVRFTWLGSDGNFTKGVTDWLSNPAGTGAVVTEGDLTGNTSIEIPSSATAAFSNVGVAGQNTVTATIPGDTLNLVAGTGVTITTNGTDSVTINSSASSGSGSTEVGAVGTYALLREDGFSRPSRSPGDTLAGSSLVYVGFNTAAVSGTAGIVTKSVSAAPGTWRLMGSYDTNTLFNAFVVSLWVRIA